MRRDAGGSGAGGWGLEALEGRQLLSVPTLAPVGPELSVTTGAMPPAGVSVEADGSFVLAWTANSDSGQSVSAMQFSKEMPPGGVIDVSGESTTQASFLPNVASGSDGSFMVVWIRGDESGVTEVFGRVYSDIGAPVTDAFEIGSTPTGSAFLPSVAALPGDGFVVTWYETQPDKTDPEVAVPVGVFAQMFDTDGGSDGGVFQVSTNVDSRGMTLPQVETGVDGEFTIAWMRNDKDLEQTEILAQRFSQSGAKIGLESVVTQAPAVFEMLGGHMPTYSFDIDSEGNHLFAWDQTQGSEPWSVYAQYFDDYFHAQGDAKRISGDSDYSQYYSSVGFAPNGSAAVVWQGARAEGEVSGRVVLAAQLDSETREVVNRFDVSDVLDGSHVDLKPRMEVDSFGGFTAAWAGLGGPEGGTSSLIIRTFMAVEAAEIVVTGDGQDIANGSTETSHDNNTDFGFVDSDGGTHTHAFEIKNTGNIALDLADITIPEGFTVGTPPATIAPGETGTLEITLAGEAGIGEHTGVVSIGNNVEGMNPFTFTITGEVRERKTVEFTRNTPAAQRTFIDEEGNTVVFTLTGPGVGFISLNPRTHELLDLDLDGTTRASNLTINVSKTKGVGTGSTAINNVYIDGSLNVFSAGKVDLFDDFRVRGTLSSLVMGDLYGLDEHVIDIGGSVNTRTDFTFGHINDLHIETNGYIGQFKAVEWLDLDGKRDEMFTGSIVALTITGQSGTETQPFSAGDLSVDIQTYNTGRPMGQPSVGSITVAGEAYDSQWDLHGYTGAIKLGSAESMYIKCEDGFGSFTVSGEVNESSLLAGYAEESSDDGFVGARAGTITVGAWYGGMIGANTLNSFNAMGRAKTASRDAISGDVVDLDLTVQGFDLADNALAINSFKAAGFASFVELESGGNVGSVWLGKDAEEFHVHGDGDLRTFTVVGLAQECMLDVLGNMGTVQVAHWSGGLIEGMTLNLLSVTGRAKTAALPALSGDIDAELILHGNLDKPNANTLGTLRVAGKLHGVDGRSIDVDVTGSVGTVVSGSLERLAFTVRPIFGGNGTKIGSVTTGYTDYWDITAPGVAVGSITVANWHDAQLFASKVGTVNIRGQAAKGGQPAIAGDFIKGLIQINEDGPTMKGNALGALTVAGKAVESDVVVKGSVGSITVGSGDDLHVDIQEGNLNTFTSKGEMQGKSGINVGGVLQSVRSVNWLSGGIQAWKIGTINITGSAKTGASPAVAGDFMGGIAATGQGQAETALLLGSLTVAGEIQSSVVSSPGNVGTIMAGAMRDSTVFAGIGSEFPFHTLPTDKSAFVNLAASIRSFTITATGRPADQASFINSVVAASTLTSVSIKLVASAAEDADLYGFSAATKIGTYRRIKAVSGGTETVVVSNKTLPGTYDTEGTYRLLLVNAGVAEG